MLDWWYELKEWWTNDVSRKFKSWFAFVGKGLLLVFLVLSLIFAFALICSALNLGRIGISIFIAIIEVIIFTTIVWLFAEVFW